VTMVAKASPYKVLFRLADSDLELIKHLCLPEKIICEKFGISRAAISMQLTRISVKLGVENRTAVVVKALGLGLVTVDQLVYRDYNGKANSS